MSLGSTGRPHLGAALIALLLVFAVLAAIMDGREAWRLIRNAEWQLVPLALLFTALSYFFLSMGFSAVNRVFDIRMDQRHLLEIGFVTFALNNLVSLGGVPGYSLRVLLMRRRGMGMADILGASLVHSYFNNLALLSLLPFGLLYLRFKHPLSGALTTWVGTATVLLLVVLAVVTVLLLNARARHFALHPLARLVRAILRRDVTPTLENLDATLRRGTELARGRPGVLVLPLLFVAADWISSMLALQFCFDTLGERINPGVLVTGFSVGVALGILSMLPGGMGVQEGSMSGVFTLLGVPFEHAVLAALLFRVVYYLVPFAASLLLYSRLLRERWSGGGAPTEAGSQD